MALDANLSDAGDAAEERRPAAAPTATAAPVLHGSPTLAPLFVVWFGFGIFPKIISAFLLGFFPVVVGNIVYAAGSAAGPASSRYRFPCSKPRCG